MKNNRIVRAYDSINPSPAEKAKMLDAILAEANLEEKPTRERKKKNTVVYTAKATKPSKRSSFMAIAASLILLLISGLVLMRMVRQSDTVSYTQPEESEQVTGFAPICHAFSMAWMATFPAPDTATVIPRRSCPFASSIRRVRYNRP